MYVSADLGCGVTMNAPVKWTLNAKTPPSVFRRNIERNVCRGLEQIVQGEAKKGPLYIVCSGPSLLDTWQELKGEPGEIWALNAAFDWLCDKGIRPDYGVCLAPEKEILRYFEKIERDDKFLFAATTNPDLMDRALYRGAEVTLWHSAQPTDWELPVVSGPLIFGGGTIGTRALDLAWTLGWRDIHLLGMDACLSQDGRIAVETPMYEDERGKLQTFICNGRAFVALPSHARQVEDFAAVTRPLKDMAITLYGDGMLQWSQTHHATNPETVN